MGQFLAVTQQSCECCGPDGVLLYETTPEVAMEITVETLQMEGSGVVRLEHGESFRLWRGDVQGPAVLVFGEKLFDDFFHEFDLNVVLKL